MFSGIASKFQEEKNALYVLRDGLIRQNYSICDLASGNVSEEGYLFPKDSLEKALIEGCRRSVVYHPDSFGQRSAREGVSDYYSGRGLRFDPDHILITPGTSLSYWYCFKLLADDGDEILCPQPSYPLFDYIAGLCGIRLIPYKLDEANGWALDTDHLQAAISSRTRAIVLISPHNPTGHIATVDEISRLAEIATRYNLAILSDEVFCEFLHGTNAFPSPASSEAPLVFTLNGFSKMFALPGMKFGWMVVSGRPDRVRTAMRTLELISDTFLPVNEIVQEAAADLFRIGESVCRGFAGRIQSCWKTAESQLRLFDHCSFVRPQGGFYVTLRLHGIDEEEAAIHLLKKHHILVHPGYFYDMRQDHLILSFFQREEIVRRGLKALKEILSDLSS